MPSPRPQRVTFQIPALDCPEELALIEKGLRRLEGVGPLAPNYLERTLHVEFDPQAVTAEAIGTRLARIGFPGEPLQADSVAAELPRPQLRATTWLGGVLLLAAGLGWLAIGEMSSGVVGLTIASAACSALPVLRAAWRAVRLGALDMNVLMALAGIGAMATGEYFEAATALFLFGLSLWLESFSLGRARRAVQSLVELSPVIAHRLVAASAASCGTSNGCGCGPAEPSWTDREEDLEEDLQGESVEDQAEQQAHTSRGAATLTQASAAGAAYEDVPPGSLAIDDVVLVRPGERLPVDGLVVAGGSAVDQAPITGESLPVDKQPGDSVYAGTLNGEGSLTVRVTAPAAKSTLAEVARLVQQAAAARSPTERFVDAFARRYTPVVIALAALLMIVPPVLAEWGVVWAAQATLGEWFHRALVLLVIACPCALVISTPVTIVCGLARGARRGLLIKGGEHLENAARIDALALDKTGTLTTGEARVVAVEPYGETSAEEVLRLAAALEQHSEHPLAAAIVAAANEQDLALPAVDQFIARRGLGIEGVIDGRRYYVGSQRMSTGNGFAASEPSRRKSLRAATPAVLTSDNEQLGTIWLADTIRDDAQAAIARLKALGVAPIALLTGDRAEVAQAVASEVGIDEVYAELFPEDKVNSVRKLAARRPQLAMVGDGVNDAPALAAARLGIALGSGASATALETADVVIVTPQLSRLVELIELGRRTRAILGQNIAFALAIKLLVLLLAAFGWATLWMAVAADVGASLIVIANGMRLLNPRESD